MAVQQLSPPQLREWLADEARASALARGVEPDMTLY